jgi:hypothetical protein
MRPSPALTLGLLLVLRRRLMAANLALQERIEP